MRSFIQANVTDDGTQWWFPMRVSYGRAMEVSKELQRLGREHYIPTNENVEKDGDGYRLCETPFVSNLIFLRGTKDEVKQLKSLSGPCSYMRFMTYTPHSEMRSDMTYSELLTSRRIIIVPDADMNRFRRTVELMRKHVLLIPYSETFNHIGKRIRIIDGPLAGTEGMLRRVKKNKHVHIDCGGILTAELDYVPSSMYQLLD